MQPPLKRKADRVRIPPPEPLGSTNIRTYNYVMPSILQDENAVRLAVGTTNCMRDCLIALGLRAAGGNYQALVRAARKFNIALKRGEPSTGIERARLAITRPLEEVMVENSNYNRSQLKKRLIRDGILKNECFNCGLGPFWENSPLSLHLEHKNGIHNDHRLENLCLLCPNCHSQTSTFAGRNSKYGKAKRDKLFIKSTKIKRKYYTRTNWPEYTDLVAEVSATSKSYVARRLNVSEAAVRKRLRKYASE